MKPVLQRYNGHIPLRGPKRGQLAKGKEPVAAPVPDPDAAMEADELQKVKRG